MANYWEDIEHSFKAQICEDDEFAKKIYAACTNIEWKHNDGSVGGESFRAAAAIIAMIREKGENYMDWYCCSPEGVVDWEIEVIMAMMGWTFDKMK
jgi:hypothetical protein